MGIIKTISNYLANNKPEYFYYDISPLKNVKSFETFNLNKDLLNACLVISNDNNKIFIYSISETKQISLKQTIKINYKKIKSIKYFNKNDKNYLVALGNALNKIIIFEIKNINTFEQIYENENNHFYMSGYPSKRHNIKIIEYLLFFKDNKIYLFVIYNASSGCCYDYHIIEIYDIKDNILIRKYVCGSNVFYISLIQWKNIIFKFCKFLTFPMKNDIMIYNFFNSENIKVDEKKSIDEEGNEIIYETLSVKNKYYIDTIKNAGGKFLFINNENKLDYAYTMIPGNNNTTIVIKTSFQLKEIVTKIELNFEIKLLLLLNEKYCILIEKNSKIIKLLNLKNWNIEIEKELQNNNENENITNAKVAVINKDEKIIIIKTDTDNLYFIELKI